MKTSFAPFTPLRTGDVPVKFDVRETLNELVVCVFWFLDVFGGYVGTAEVDDVVDCKVCHANQHVQHDCALPASVDTDE